MVAFRHAKITNFNNTAGIELNDFDGYLMTSPTGFGIYRVVEYITVGNQRMTVDNRPQFNKITFNIDIFGTREEMEQKYAKLRNFISKNLKQGFRLYYKPLDESRYIYCDITIVDKTEKALGYLPIKLEIQPKSLWLSDVQKNSVQQAVTGGNLFVFEERTINDQTYYSASFDLIEGLKDEYDRNIYAINFASDALNQVTLYNAGEETTPLIIRIYGTAVNPLIRLYKYGSNIASQIIEFNDLTILDGYYLEINSNPESNYIELVNEATGERFDREDYVRLDTNVYMNLPQGNWNIIVTDESGENEAFTNIFYTNQYYGG